MRFASVSLAVTIIDYWCCRMKLNMGVRECIIATWLCKLPSHHKDEERVCIKMAII